MQEVRDAIRAAFTGRQETLTVYPAIKTGSDGELQRLVASALRMVANSMKLAVRTNVAFYPTQKYFKFTFSY